MTLAIDIGNTFVKAAVFDKEQVIDTFKAEIANAKFVETILNSYPGVEAAIVGSSRKYDQEGVARMVEELKKRMKRLMCFDSSTPIPIKNLYRTPETLGADRLAAAVGAATLYPNSNVLLVDFGTAITIDVVNDKGEYLGGNISPGAAMRFNALNQHTSKLPLVELAEGTTVVGDSSRQAIVNGVVNGIVYEIEGYVAQLERDYDDLRIIFTGGDSDFFAKRFKNTIFATYDLVVYGLNRILEYNAE